MKELPKRAREGINALFLDSDGLSSAGDFEDYDAQTWKSEDPRWGGEKREKGNPADPRVVREIRDRGFEVREEEVGKYVIYEKGEECAYANVSKNKPPALGSLREDRSIPDGILRAFIRVYGKGFDLY